MEVRGRNQAVAKQGIVTAVRTVECQGGLAVQGGILILSSIR